MPITTAPKEQNLVQLELARAQLQEAAELAADKRGMVDTTKVSGEMREMLELLGGGSRFELSALARSLDEALDKLDRADIGGGAALYFGYQGVSDLEYNAIHRRSENDREVKAESPILGRIRLLMMRSRNMVLEPEERASVESDPGAKAVLGVADHNTEARSRALAEKHFTGIQVLHRDYWDVPDPSRNGPYDDGTRREYTGFVRGQPGALTDIDSVMVKHHRTGKWFATRVEADGSYEIPLGKHEGEFAVWYETKDGARFLGGHVMMFNNTHTDDLGGFSLNNGQPRFTTEPPLRFAPRRER